MRLGEESGAERGVGIRGGSEQLAEKALLSFVKTNDRRITPGFEVERVALERQQ